jgi:peptide/nickel transport system permease protein
MSGSYPAALDRRGDDLSGRIALLVVVALVLLAVASPLLVGMGPVTIGEIRIPRLLPLDPYEVDLSARLQAPSARHWLGTDELGRDLLARLIAGARLSIGIGLGAALLAFLFGTIAGALAGYFRGWIDFVVLRLIEIIVCFPFFFLVLAIVAVLGQSVGAIVLALAVGSWTSEARLVRGEMMKVRELDYAVAARASGAGGIRIAIRHLLPNSVGPAIVSASFGAAGAILGESALSFLGFGVPLPYASWGSILASATHHLRDAWWLSLFPGLAIFITVAAFNLLGERLRRSLDPRL